MLSAKVLNKHDSAKVEMKGTKKAAKMKNLQAIWCNKTQNQETGDLIAMNGGHQWGWP